MEVDNKDFNEEKTFVSLETEKNPEPTPEAAADSKPPADQQQIPAADSKPENQRTNPGAAAERKHLNIWLNLPKINQEKYKKLVQELAAENIPDPNQKDVIRITRLSPGQSSLYLKAFRAAKKAAAE
jgi:hypothetical protein